MHDSDLHGRQPDHDAGSAPYAYRPAAASVRRGGLLERTLCSVVDAVTPVAGRWRWPRPMGRMTTPSARSCGGSSPAGPGAPVRLEPAAAGPGREHEPRRRDLHRPVGHAAPRRWRAPSAADVPPRAVPGAEGGAPAAAAQLLLRTRPRPPPGMWNPGTIRANAEIFDRTGGGRRAPSAPSGRGRPTGTTSSSSRACTGGCARRRVGAYEVLRKFELPEVRNLWRVAEVAARTVAFTVATAGPAPGRADPATAHSTRSSHTSRQ